MGLIQRLRRLTLLGSGALLLVYAGLVGGAALLSRLGPRVMLPETTPLWGLAGLGLFVLSQGLAALAGRGFLGRLRPLLVLLPGAVAGLLAFAFVELALRSQPIGRLGLPDGRTVLLTLEPVPTDAVFALWEGEGIGWRRVLPPHGGLTYSEDGSFAADPALVLTPDGRHLLVRRGGIWTDCVKVEPVLRNCRSQPDQPMTAAEHHERSAWIAETAGLDPAVPETLAGAAGRRPH